MHKQVVNYLKEIGRRGGKKSRRSLDPNTARYMVMLREARRAFKMHHSMCFWSYDVNWRAQSAQDIKWVGEQLMKHGNRALWEKGLRLCR